MRCAISEIFIVSHELLKDKKYREVLSKLGEIDYQSISPRDKAEYCLLEAESRLMTGDCDVKQVINYVINYSKSNHDDKQFAQAKLLSGMRLIRIGDFIEAKESLVESYASFKKCDDYAGQAWTLNRLAFIALHCGDANAAIAHLNRCILIYKESDRLDNIQLTLNNLAQINQVHGNLRESISQSEKLDLSIFNCRDKNLGNFYITRSFSYALIGNCIKAKKILDKAFPILTEFPKEKAICLEILGWIHILEGDYENAEKALLEGLKISLDIAPESALISQTKRLLADTYFGLGKYDESRKYADEALAVAEKLNERAEIAACYRAYGKLESKNDDRDKGRQWFKKSIDMYAMIGSRYELATTRYLAAVSGMYHNGERQALLYLAREYFESEDVTHYIEKINREIKRVRIMPVPGMYRLDGEPPAIIAVSPEMKRLVDLVENVAPSNMSVLLTGSTGTGKDLFARFIHHHSGRKGNFVSVNAAAIPDNMIESELFGYKKGAYTGADRTTNGLIEEADGGTFYLNEIADASAEMQAKLLDVLETRTVRLLGERAVKSVDFRVIAATNHDLEQMIIDGKFRADLYHRLKEIPITLPPLSERTEDIPTLLEHFLELGGVDLDEKDARKNIDRLAEMFTALEWPGNIREFRAEVDRLILMSQGKISRMADVTAQGNLSEKDQLLALLSLTGWNRSKVAKILGITEGTVRHRIKKYDISEDENS